jgi:hypothetical protein
MEVIKFRSFFFGDITAALLMVNEPDPGFP